MILLDSQSVICIRAKDALSFKDEIDSDKI